MTSLSFFFSHETKAVGAGGGEMGVQKVKESFVSLLIFHSNSGFFSSQA